jgi:hypothetical protein
MLDATNIYSYTPEQAQLIKLYDTYRTCLMKAKYYGHKLKSFRRLNVWMDIITALAASSALTGQAIMKTPIGLNFASVLLVASAVIAILKPIFKIGEAIDRYSKLFNGYNNLFYRIEGLTDDIRRSNTFTVEYGQKAVDIFDNFRELQQQGDSEENRKRMLKYQDEVDRAIPFDRLWLPA